MDADTGRPLSAPDRCAILHYGTLVASWTGAHSRSTSATTVKLNEAPSIKRKSADSLCLSLKPIPLRPTRHADGTVVRRLVERAVSNWLELSISFSIVAVAAAATTALYQNYSESIGNQEVYHRKNAVLLTEIHPGHSLLSLQDT